MSSATVVSSDENASSETTNGTPRFGGILTLRSRPSNRIGADVPGRAEPVNVDLENARWRETASTESVMAAAGNMWYSAFAGRPRSWLFPGRFRTLCPLRASGAGSARRSSAARTFSVITLSRDCRTALG